MISRKIKNLTQKGDTIVEVLLAIAVVSFILAISYGLANRSTQGMQKAHERSEALKEVEGQLDILRNYLAGDDATWTDAQVCFIESTDPGDPPFVPTNDPNSCNFGVDDRYAIDIEKNDNVYTATARWEKIGGGSTDPNDVINLSYKIPPGSLIAGGDVGGLSGNSTDEDGDGVTIGERDPNDRDPCDPNENSPACLSAGIQVTARKIPPNSNNTTPDCSAAATANKSGSGVNLSRSGYSQTQWTNGASQTTFNNLSRNRAYTANVSAPEGYSACSPTTLTVTAQSPPSQLDFKIRPICTVEQRSEQRSRQVARTGYRLVPQTTNTYSPFYYYWPIWFPNAKFVDGRWGDYFTASRPYTVDGAYFPYGGYYWRWHNSNYGGVNRQFRFAVPFTRTTTTTYTWEAYTYYETEYYNETVNVNVCPE